MGVRGDERGQAIQVGAILLFAFLVIALASYQAVLVPQQNAEVEFRHSQQVAGDVVELRSAVVDAWATGRTRTATVHMGTTYPARIIAVNPSAPGGRLGTGTAGEIRVRGPGDSPVSICGSNSVTSRVLTYEPGYNEYGSAPTNVYENTVAFRQFEDAVRLDSAQQLVRSETINVIALATEYGASGTTARSIDVVPGEQTTTHVEIPPGQTLTVTFPSRLSATTWNDTLLQGQPRVIDVTEAGDEITVTLNGSDPAPGPGPPTVNFTVTCRQIGLDRAP